MQFLLVFLMISVQMLHPPCEVLVWGLAEQQLPGNLSASLSDLSVSDSGTADEDDIEEWEDQWDVESETSDPVIGEEINFPVFTDTPTELPDEDPTEDKNPTAEENVSPEDHTGTSPVNSYTSGGRASSGSTTREEVIRKPKLILESSNLSEKELNPGSTEQLEVTLRNKSPKQAIYNLKISLANASGELQLTQSTFYYDKINPGGGIHLSESIKVSGNIQSVCVPLVFNFTYEDSKGNEATDTETLNLFISHSLRMELEAASIPEVLYASETVEIPVKAMNLSRTEAYNARITLSATGLFPKEEAFLGTIEAGTAGEGTLRVYTGTRTMKSIGNDPGAADSEKYGPITGTITLQYEDASGTSYQIESDFQSEIKKAQILSLKVEEEEQPNPWWISILAAAFLALLAVIILLIRLIRRKNILLEEAQKERNPQNAS